MPARLFDGKHAAAREVVPTVEGGSLLIRSADGSVALDWPLRRVSVQEAPGGTATLRHGRDPARLVVDDPAQLARLRAGLGRRWPRRQAGWPALGATCAAVLGLGVLLVHSAPDLLAPLVPRRWEAALGARVEAALLSRTGTCTGAEGRRALERLVHRLARAAEVEGAVELAVADDPMVNAFTVPGNRVVVMRGLIDGAGDGDELAGVLAHELGHVARRDPTRRLVRQLGLSAVGAALGWGGLDAGGVAGTLLGFSYGRAAETAADSTALAALRRAGLRADGLGRFFERLGDDAPGLPLLADHPPTAERRERARQGTDGAPAFTEAEWRAIRAMCGPAG